VIRAALPDNGPVTPIARCVLVASLAAGLAITGPSAQAANKCRFKHTRTLASSRKVRIFAQNGRAKVCYRPSGKRFTLDDTFPGEDAYAVGGRFIGFSISDPEDDSTPEHSIVRVFRMPNGGTPEYLPYRTGAQVDDIVVKRNGAAAWATTHADGTTRVTGTRRKGHAPEQLSAAARAVRTTTLTSGSGGRVTWRYTDGTTGSAALYTAPAKLFF
jgi:hypothetical protein